MLDGVAAHPSAVGAAPPGRGGHAEVRAKGSGEHLGRGESHVERDGEGGIPFAQEPPGGDLHSTAPDPFGEGLAGEGLEDAVKVPGRNVRHGRELGEIERVGQVRVDVVEHAVDASDVVWIGPGHGVDLS